MMARSLAAARRIHARIVTNELGLGTAARPTGDRNRSPKKQIQKVYAPVSAKGEQLGYARGLADAAAGTVRTSRSEIGDEIDWAKRVFEAATNGKACLRDQDVDFANEMLAKFNKWGKGSFFSQPQHNYARVIETKLKRAGYL